MKSFTKTLITKRKLAEIMLRPICISEYHIEKCIEKIIPYPNHLFLKDAKKCTNLNIAQFINNTFIIRYEIN